MITSPIASDEWANKPNKASLGRFVLVCNWRRKIAITADIKKTDKAILSSNTKAIVTPNKAECASVPAKKDNLLQITKHPIGPVIKAIPIPASKALIKKSSSILFLIYCSVLRVSMVMFMFVKG